MARNAIALEEERLSSVEALEDYDMVHERHRIFPEVFADRAHRRVIDLSAGVGVVAQRIVNGYPCELVCNDISPKCLRILKDMGLDTMSFDLDTAKGFPLKDESFDAVVSLATIEHLTDTERFLKEINRILRDGGYLYLSAPNYNGLLYLLRVIFTGRTFHDPLNPREKYEFFGHLRYFTYRTLAEFVSQFGFSLEAVYVALPRESTKYTRLRNRSRIMALVVRFLMGAMYRLASARWASEPVLCFRKSSEGPRRPRKVVL